MTQPEKLSKTEVALRQLETAIKLYIYDGDAVSAYTLVRASEEILDKLCAYRELDRSMLHRGMNELPITEERKKDIRKRLNEPKNFFKHADKDPEAIIDWSDGVVQHYIIDCVSMYRRLNPETEIPCELLSFQMIYRANNPDLYDEVNTKETEQALAKLRDEISSYGIQSVYESFIEVCKMNQK